MSQTSLHRFEEYLWQAAGLGATCVMKKAPKVEMPTEEISEGMKELLKEVRDDVLNYESNIS